MDGVKSLRVSKSPDITLALHNLGSNHLTQRIPTSKTKMPNRKMDASLVDEEEVTDAGADEIFQGAHGKSPESSSGVDIVGIGWMREENAVSNYTN